MIRLKIIERINYALLLAISCTIYNIKLCTILIIIYTSISLFQIKNIKFNKERIIIILILAIPFLLDFITLWNNDTLMQGWKQAEKRLSFIIFPLFILGIESYRKFDIYKFLRIYAIAMPTILSGFLFMFNYHHHNLVEKYLNGIHLWEMGYTISNYIGIHAPFLNIQLAFIVAINFYFILYYFKKSKISLLISAFFFVLSFGLILIVNTRLALILSVIAFMQILISEGIRQLGKRKTVLVGVLFFSVVGIVVYSFNKKFPYYEKKFKERTFSHMNLLGKLDEINEPNKGVFLVSRLTMWKSALEVAMEKPILGHGAGRAKPDLFKYYKKTNQKYLFEYQQPVHNQYIDFFLKQGVLGALFFCVFMICFGYVSIKSINPLPLSLFIIFSIGNLTEDLIIRFYGISFFALFISLFVNDYLNQKDNVEKLNN